LALPIAPAEKIAIMMFMEVAPFASVYGRRFFRQYPLPFASGAR